MHLDEQVLQVWSILPGWASRPDGPRDAYHPHESCCQLRSFYSIVGTCDDRVKTRLGKAADHPRFSRESQGSLKLGRGQAKARKLLFISLGLICFRWLQQPQLRLRNLESVQAWNLQPGSSAASFSVHYALWSRAVPRGEAWPILHVSKEVCQRCQNISTPLLASAL